MRKATKGISKKGKDAFSPALLLPSVFRAGLLLSVFLVFAAEGLALDGYVISDNFACDFDGYLFKVDKIEHKIGESPI